ncbi:ABC transporter substrate-binding protein [Actinosynnema sp. NPDC020468]|uniref:ABC transporter substrate-binding protein n=1 Tax=Actinosynnema sp. NPDC020468 TaxID=3154488 RepID=UPI0033CDC66F
MRTDPPRHLYLILPNPRRRRRRAGDWTRLVLAVALVVVAGTGAWWGPFLWRRWGCADGALPSAAVWGSAGECVGLTEGPYAFGLPEFAAVLGVIDAQNRAAADRCGGTPATVGVLMTMTDQFAGARAVHELEGMAAAQARANGTACLHPTRLLVGNVGRYDGTSTAVDVARAMAARPEVVAVAGVGLSHQSSAEVADLLAADRIPMVSDLITAEGFDQEGSRADDPGFQTCDRGTTYRDGVGEDYFRRVAFRAAAQIAELHRLVPARPDFLMVPTGGSDPYTCTALPLMQRGFGGEVPAVKFDAQDPSTVPQTARRVCAKSGAVTVAYIARGRDLGRFLYSLDEAFGAGQCPAESITVLSTSDGNRVRAVESDPVLEDLRVKALGSGTFADGRVRLVLTLVAGADASTPDAPGYAEFEKTFTGAGFDLAHTDDGWAVNAYDALTTVSHALRALPAGRPVARGGVATEMGFANSPDRAVPGAGGPITFDNAGNRTDAPPVVRLCPLPPPTGDHPARVTSVPVHTPGTPATC